MPLPQWRRVNSETRLIFKTIDQKIEQRCLGSIDDVMVWCASLSGAKSASLPRVRELEHRLSDEMARRTLDTPFEPRTPIEWMLVNSVTQRLTDFLATPDLNFKDQVCALHAELVGATLGIRKTEIRSTPDLNGTYVVFPSPSVVENQLDALSTSLRQNIDHSASFTAAASMAAICNIHPFSDANGRVSRLIFNGFLRRAGYQFYVPLHEIGRISRGGFLIALRLAQYRQDWLALGRFLLNAVEFTQALASWRGPARPLDPAGEASRP